MSALVSMSRVSKAFGGVHAVEDASLAVHAGEVLALLGHNGAGKSTLMKVLAGAFAHDAGEIRIDGRAVEMRSPVDSQALGIETIYQTLALADNLDAVSNLFLGRELLTRYGTLDDYAMETAARAVFKRLNPNFQNIRVPVRSLSGGQRQVVAISRALYFNARVLIMDGARPGEDAEGAGRRHHPHLARHAGRVRAQRPPLRDEERPHHRHLPHQ
jgi:D-xylose transport system ATP-binding protein